MAKTKIILASTLSVLAVASVTTAAVVVTQKRKQDDSPKKGNEGNQVVVAANSKLEYDLNAEQTNELTAKLLLVKGQDVTVTLTENNASKTIKTKVKEDGTVDFSSLKDGKTYKVTKIVVKEGEKERDLIAEVKEPKEKPGNDAQPGGTTKPTDPTNGDGKKPGDAAKPTEPIQSDNPSVSGSSAGGATGKETPGQAGNAESGNPQVGGAESGGTQPGGAQAGKPQTSGAESGNPQADGAESGGTQPGGAQAGKPQTSGAESGKPQTGGAESSNPQADEKEAEIKKVTIVQQQYDKSTGYINFWFKTTKENFEKMRTKSWKMEFDLGGNWQNIETDAAKTGTSGNENVAIVSNLNDGVVVFMSTNYYYNKATNAPQTTYKLINLYYDNNKSNNVLSEPSKDIQVKYE
ncbi:Uncharacterised protein [Mycoplasmopsis bovigenitalium]|uniref:Uncharacterized protein n=1 Tax=Mycoplasmopsis bovigenitalium TaxID=2112 RepID=A0A449A9K8_9BACT|nr:hypothetical protein [Mycoplasmopsis bovigenitalium]VEU60870.1 Uncharacterised protein [Mycoplasmopsis bovigenitalium]